MPIWPAEPPDSVPVSGPETSETADNLVAGKKWTYVGRVTRPTITLYPARGTNTGAALLVFPGGGYQGLATDLEGTEICEWFANRGINCVLLMYRVPGNQRYSPPAYPKSGPYPESPLALEDAQRAMGLVRFHASDWGIDPHKIGVIGFSAGGYLVAAISTHYAKRLYPSVDGADNESCRPDFAVTLYPGHLTLSAAESDARQSPNKFVVKEPSGHFNRQHVLNPYIPVTRDTPPAFLVQAEDDPVDDVNNSKVYYAALRKAGVPAELHLFPHGGHAFGLRRTNMPITRWPELVLPWIRRVMGG